MTAPSIPHKKNGRLIILAVAAVCILPLLAALYFRYISPPSQVNMVGEALPPIQVTPMQWSMRGPEIDGKKWAEASANQWLITHVAPRACDEACMTRLHLTRQARVAMYKDITRVQRALLLADNVEIPALPAEQDDLRILRLPAEGPIANLREDSIYLIDRRGYLVFRYDGTAAPKDFIRELNRLVKF